MNIPRIYGMKGILNLLLLVFLAGCGGQIFAFGNLSAAELRALIAGNTAEGELRAGVKGGIGPPTMLENYPEYFVAYFDAGGVVKHAIDGTMDDGKWRISNGGKLCMEWQDRKEQCAPVHKEGRVYKRITRNRFGRILQELKFIRFMEGNERAL